MSPSLALVSRSSDERIRFETFAARWVPRREDAVPSAGFIPRSRLLYASGRTPGVEAGRPGAQSKRKRAAPSGISTWRKRRSPCPVMSVARADAHSIAASEISTSSTSIQITPIAPRGASPFACRPSAPGSHERASPPIVPVTIRDVRRRLPALSAFRPNRVIRRAANRRTCVGPTGGEIPERRWSSDFEQPVDSTDASRGHAVCGVAVDDVAGRS
jgi:hypothetical protein